MCALAIGTLHAGVVMNLKLVLGLSTIALVATIATVFVIPPAAFAPCWIAVMLACALGVARLAPGRFFPHGFLVGLLNWFWVTASHVLFFPTWAARHAPDLAGMRAMGGLTDWMHHYGVPIPGASGLVIGALAWGLARVPALRRRKVDPNPNSGSGSV